MGDQGMSMYGWRLTSPPVSRHVSPLVWSQYYTSDNSAAGYVDSQVRKAVESVRPGAGMPSQLPTAMLLVMDVPVRVEASVSLDSGRTIRVYWRSASGKPRRRVRISARERYASPEAAVPAFGERKRCFER